MLVTVRGKEFQIDPEILKVSPYFKSLIDWNDPGELELDNNIAQFEKLLSFLKGEDSDPGPLGEFYMCGKSIGSMSEFGNVLEWVSEPLQADDVNASMISLVHKFDKCVYQQSVVESSMSNKVILEIPISFNNCTYIKNLKFITNQKFKHLKITVSECLPNPDRNRDHCVIFDEPRHDFMFENLSKLPGFHRRLYFADVRVRIEATLDSMDSWVQVVYDSVYLPRDLHKKYFDEKRYYFKNNKEIYSNVDIEGNERIVPYNQLTQILAHRNDIEVSQPVGGLGTVREKEPINCKIGQLYFPIRQNTIIYVSTVKKYLGCVDRIEFPSILFKQFHILLSKANGPIKYNFSPDTYNQTASSFSLSEPFNTMMCKQKNKNPDYFHITVERKKYSYIFIQLDQPTDVWIEYDNHVGYEII